MFQPAPGRRVRFADVVGTNPTTGETLIVQIGRTNPSTGTPLIRERRALMDIMLSPDYPTGPTSLIFVRRGSTAAVPLPGWTFLRRKNSVGKQVSFYMTAKDEASFLEHVSVLAPVKFFRSKCKSKEEISFTKLGSVDTDRFVYLCRADVDPRIVLDFVKEQNVYCLDFLNSEVIELRRSRSEGRRLFAGRLWFDERKSGGTKRLMFCDWAKKVLAFIKKKYDYKDYFYLGPNTVELMADSELELAPGR